MEPINEVVRENIKKYRKLRKMTQKELAETLDVTHSSVSAWEIGKNSIDMSRLNEICTVLDVSISEIMEEDLDDEKIKIEEKNKKIMETINNRPEVKRLMMTTFDSRNDDVIIAVKLLEALKRR